MTSRFSVIIPNYNGGKFIAQTLESLLRQTYSNFPIVVLDNRSTDDSVARAQSTGSERVKVIVAEDHLPMAANWNRALHMANTEYFALCHSDDLYEPRFVETLLGELEQSPDAFVAHCRAKTIDENGTEVFSPFESFKNRFWPAGETYERRGRAEIEALLRGNYIILPSAVYRKSALQGTGDFPESYGFAPDWLFWAQGVAAGYSVLGVREQLMSYRRHSNNNFRAFEKSHRKFSEEIACINAIYDLSIAKGILGADVKRDYSLVKNTAASEFAARLKAGNADDARKLLEFCDKEIPDFHGSIHAMVLSCTLRLGTFGGRLLNLAGDAYLKLS